MISAIFVFTVLVVSKLVSIYACIWLTNAFDFTDIEFNRNFFVIAFIASLSLAVVDPRLYSHAGYEGVCIQHKIIGE